MNKVESADLILKLYDLRREPVMRKAREWFTAFTPESVDDINKAMMDEEVGGYCRMVPSYWEMAASLVNHGAIDAEMFKDTVGEHILVFSKIEPFLGEMREQWESPDMYKHLEKVIYDLPDGKERLAKMREMMKAIGEQTEESAAGA